MVGITRSKVILAFETSATASCGYMLWNTNQKGVPFRQFSPNPFNIHISTQTIFQQRIFFKQIFNILLHPSIFHVSVFIVDPLTWGCLARANCWSATKRPRNFMLTKSSPLETQNKKPKCDSNMICVWFYIGFCMVLCMYNYVYIYIYWFLYGFILVFVRWFVTKNWIKLPNEMLSCSTCTSLYRCEVFWIFKHKFAELRWEHKQNKQSYRSI